MDKENISLNHSIVLNERKNINITEIKKIDNFDNEEFLMETNMGYIRKERMGDRYWKAAIHVT